MWSRSSYAPLEAYGFPGGAEHSAYCGPAGALVLDIFAPPRKDYLKRWSEGPG